MSEKSCKHCETSFEAWLRTEILEGARMAAGSAAESPYAFIFGWLITTSRMDADDIAKADALCERARMRAREREIAEKVNG